MPLPPNFLDELRARTPLPTLVGRSVRLLRSGKEHKACCPFHSEKTPSFYIYEDRFHCFGCGEHGDAISFVMKTQGASFMEAVESLAADAGLEVPKASPGEAQLQAKRTGLQEVLAAAAKIYQNWLFAPQGAAGLSYLRSRGLTDATIKKFGLGWSGEGRGAIAHALKDQKIGTELLVEAGLMKQGDYGPVDMFFSRVMFQVQDRRGAILSFSGRIIGDGQPKYVNGPETAVFSKRRSLFGLSFAREAVRRGEPLIIVEGQMDVIALAQAGFGGAVAPLGTALTEEQLAEIWRLSPEPILGFDADSAGRKAAIRAVELALSGLGPEQSLKFLKLPDGEDPDSLIRKQGPAAFKAQLDAAQPLSAVLFDMLAEGANRSTPEGWTALRSRLSEMAGRIGNKTLAAEYHAALQARCRDERFLAGRARIAPGFKRSAGSGNAPKFTRLRIDPTGTDMVRGRILTAILIAHPVLLPDVEEAYALLDLPEACARLRKAFSRYHDQHETLEPGAVRDDFRRSGFSADIAEVLPALPASAAEGAGLAEVANCWWHFFSLMQASRSKLREQRDDQHRQHVQNPDDMEIWRKLVRLNVALQRADGGEQEDP